MKSKTLALYTKALSTATSEQVEFVDSVYALCEENYAAGGDVICETFSPKEILAEFTSLKEVKAFCKLHVDAETNARWGEDSDPVMQRPQWN